MSTQIFEPHFRTNRAQVHEARYSPSKSSQNLSFENRNTTQARYLYTGSKSASPSRPYAEPLAPILRRRFNTVDRLDVGFATQVPSSFDLIKSYDLIQSVKLGFDNVITDTINTVKGSLKNPDTAYLRASIDLNAPKWQTTGQQLRLPCNGGRDADVTIVMPSPIDQQ
jgi:hypothetical protein